MLQPFCFEEEAGVQEAGQETSQETGHLRLDMLARGKKVYI